MMDAEWSAILRRYGQNVQVRTQGQEDKILRAFLQPILDKDTQLAPSPLGLRREERALYLGPADVAIFPRETVVVWQGRSFEVRSARNVGDGHHIWAILQALEGET